MERHITSKCHFQKERLNITTVFYLVIINFAMKESLIDHHIPPNHVQVEPRYYHGDGSEITVLPWSW